VSGDVGTVRCDRRGAAAVITIDRPTARNAMTWAMYDELDEALDRVESLPDLRVAVLRGAGGHFVAGTDIAQFTAFASGDDGLAYEHRLEMVVAKLESLRVATIAAVQGYAAGAGLVLAAACDLRVCTPDARFGVPIAKTIGNTLSLENVRRLLTMLGVARTKSLVLAADFISADEARMLGFVGSVVDAAAFDAAVDSLVARVAAHAPITIQATKEAVRRIVSGALGDGDDLVHRAYDSDDFREGVRAFVEKREPRWQGR
jgi:enoyl-CoA hydratase/carnithine racemase